MGSYEDRTYFSYIHQGHDCSCLCVTLQNMQEMESLLFIWGEINDLGGISLSLFLGMAMITLKLWQFASLALPLVILLGAQIIVIVLFTYFIVFNIMGRDYDAAVLVAGTCVWNGSNA